MSSIGAEAMARALLNALVAYASSLCLRLWPADNRSAPVTMAEHASVRHELIARVSDSKLWKSFIVLLTYNKYAIANNSLCRITLNTGPPPSPSPMNPPVNRIWHTANLGSVEEDTSKYLKSNSSVHSASRCVISGASLWLVPSPFAPRTPAP